MKRYLTSSEHLIEPLRKIKIAKFIFHLKPEESIILPSYKGSTLRGGLGTAFRKIACVNRKEKECKTCSLKDKCVYIYIFETMPHNKATRLKKLQSIPRPFIIEPPGEKKKEYLKDEIIVFNLILIGRAINYLPYFILAFKELGKVGIGKKGGKYKLERVYNYCRERIYSGDDDVLRKAKSYLDVFYDYHSFLNNRYFSLSFLTPTRIKFKGDLVVIPEFHILIRALLHRLSSIFYFHCGEELNLDFSSLIKKAEKIIIKKKFLKWIDWQRYSTRQKTKMRLGGFVGKITYYGEIEEFLPLFILGQYTHIGKNCTFGLGKYEIVKDVGKGEGFNP